MSLMHTILLRMAPPVSLHSLMYFRRARTSIELLLGTPSEVAYETDNAYVSVTSERMRQAYAVVREQLQVGYDRAKKCYDERVKSCKFQEGEFVWHFVPRTRRGLNKKWLSTNRGPYRIIKQINDVNYIVKRVPKAKPEIVHIDQLSRYHGAIPPLWKNTVAMEKSALEKDQTLSEENQINERDKNQLNEAADLSVSADSANTGPQNVTLHQAAQPQVNLPVNSGGTPLDVSTNENTSAHVADLPAPLDLDVVDDNIFSEGDQPTAEHNEQVNQSTCTGFTSRPSPPIAT